MASSQALRKTFILRNKLGFYSLKYGNVGFLYKNLLSSMTSPPTLTQGF